MEDNYKDIYKHRLMPHAAVKNIIAHVFVSELPIPISIGFECDVRLCHVEIRYDYLFVFVVCFLWCAALVT